ncbi:flagellar M-ring protein FliF [Ruminiclostridium sufflavum DSM 19573]|uniref:Flagellar M-ring protein FliF n=1 Tax=Ruminiclostridium sufflavum DSM 19573 TaxID=1121337 RepID=A0A318Y2S3_9FIRM|nr:flagellar M-ring protein FliF [Ruminiclostridium sufflavum DSM 19573]
MPEFLSKILKPIVDFWKGLEKSQKIRIYITAGIVTVAVGLGLYLLTKPTYTTVIENASSTDIAAMQKVLTEKGISYKLTDNKAGIIVDVKDSDNAHLELATAGYPKNGLTFADALSNIKINTTESDKKHIWQELDESDIARQLKLIQNVKDASVTISVPESTLFIDSTNNKDAKASVVITRDGEITPEQAQNIVKVVASSVEGLDPSNVTVIDEEGNALNSDTDNEMSKTSTKYEMKIKVKTDLEENLKNVLNGQQFDSFDSAKVVVNPILDFDTLTQSSKEISNPNDMDSGAVTAKEESKEELTNGTEGETVGMDANPGTTTPSYPNGSTNAESYKKSSLKETYAYNQSEKQSEKSLGEVIPEKTTAAITLLYGNRVADDTKLTDELIAQVQDLASKATGIPVENIAVTKLKVQPKVEEVPTTAEMIKGLLSEYGLLALLLLMLIALVIVAIPRKSKQQSQEPVFAAAADELLQPKYNLNDLRQEPVPEIDTEERSEVKKQLEKFVKQKPDAVAQLLRNWLTDDYE